jgi:hypothetical protein
VAEFLTLLCGKKENKTFLSFRCEVAHVKRSQGQSFIGMTQKSILAKKKNILPVEAITRKKGSVGTNVAKLR